MDQDRRPAALKTAQLVLALVFTFTLGRFSIQFSGGGWGWLEWTAIVLHVGLVAGLVYLLVRGFWKFNV
jgi:hypothetical protein